MRGFRARRWALAVLLTLAGSEAAAQKPEERFTPTPPPTVALPRLTPSGGARADGPTPGVALQPPPAIAPNLSPIRVPGAIPAAPPPPAAPKITAPQPSAAKPTIPPPPAPEQPPAVAVAPPVPVAPPPAEKPPAEKPAPAAAPRRTVVTTADVNLRAAPKAGARVLDELERGERLEVVGPAPDGWIHVGRNGKPLGYIAAEYLADSKPATGPTTGNRPALGNYAKASRADNGCALPDDMPAEKRRTLLPVGSVARVLADANLRVAPACDAKVKDVLEAGERVTVQAVDGSWYRVGRKGETLGYVGAALLSAAKER